MHVVIKAHVPFPSFIKLVAYIMHTALQPRSQAPTLIGLPLLAAEYDCIYLFVLLLYIDN